MRRGHVQGVTVSPHAVSLWGSVSKFILPCGRVVLLGVEDQASLPTQLLMGMSRRVLLYETPVV